MNGLDAQESYELVFVDNGWTNSPDIADHFTKIEHNYRCQECGYAFPDRVGLEVHHPCFLKTHGQFARPYNCYIGNCDKSYNLLYDLRRHLVAHFPEKNFRCKHCEMETKTRPNMIRHIKLVHMKDVPLFFMCECKTMFQAEEELKQHRKEANHGLGGNNEKGPKAGRVGRPKRRKMKETQPPMTADILPFKCPAFGCEERFGTFQRRTSHHKQVHQTPNNVLVLEQPALDELVEHSSLSSKFFANLEAEL